MSYKKGDVVLINFPFTDLSKSKKRPVLIVKDENDLHDIVCLQITSKSTQNALYKIDANSLKEGELKLISFVKYDKCFTLSSEIIDKKLAAVDSKYMDELKELFCSSVL